MKSAVVVTTCRPHIADNTVCRNITECIKDSILNLEYDKDVRCDDVKAPRWAAVQKSVVMRLYRLRSLPSLSWTLAWLACLVFTLRLAPASSRPSGSTSRPTSCRTPMTRSTSTVTSTSNRYGTGLSVCYKSHCCCININISVAENNVSNIDLSMLQH